jgi:hypothetical protein
MRPASVMLLLVTACSRSTSGFDSGSGASDMGSVTSDAGARDAPGPDAPGPDATGPDAAGSDTQAVDLGVGAPDLGPVVIDAGSPDIGSICGDPGDPGNGLGVGKYCTSIGDCTGTAPLCTSIAGPSASFCTIVCDMHSDAGFCGKGAVCDCNKIGCGCVPNSCLGALVDAGL